MISLFIDTSSSDVSIALIKDDITISAIHEDIPRKHSTYVVKFIEDILKSNNLVPESVNEIIIVNGPGSFTGIRIGVTIAKVYAYLLNIRIVPITSTLARIIGLEGKYFLSLVDAKHDNYYIGLYNSDYSVIIEKFTSATEVEEIKRKYNPLVVDSTRDYDFQKIIQYTKSLSGVSPHAVNPVYLKLPEAMEKKQ